ncbi:tail fiber assembly protein [Enterobacter roggenkampii]|uniref:tail fiber assembly protein n=1 Tax=Enterobacter roggenkampii TaxID=1812935 RepID=UPI003BD1B3DE
MSEDNSVTLDAKGLAERSGTLTVYNFDPDSGIYTGNSDEYLMQGIGIPAHSTREAPPADVTGKVCLFLNGEWQQVADHRGETVYSVKDQTPTEMKVPGEYPADTTPLKPATKYDKWDGQKWVTDAEAQQKDEISAALDKKISLLAEANTYTGPWQTQLLLGIISDADKASLMVWMKYYQQVQAVDTSKLPDISWPEKPSL